MFRLVSKAYRRDVLKTQHFQEAGLFRGQDFLLNILIVLLNAVFFSSILFSYLHVFLRGSGGGFGFGVGGGFMEVKGRTKGERLVTAVTNKPVELADAATKVGLTPNLNEDRKQETKVSELLTTKALTRLLLEGG